jgi:hypothetical protein
MDLTISAAAADAAGRTATASVTVAVTEPAQAPARRSPLAAAASRIEHDIEAGMEHMREAL